MGVGVSSTAGELLKTVVKQPISIISVLGIMTSILSCSLMDLVIHITCYLIFSTSCSLLLLLPQSPLQVGSSVG